MKTLPHLTWWQWWIVYALVWIMRGVMKVFDAVEWGVHRWKVWHGWGGGRR